MDYAKKYADTILSNGYLVAFIKVFLAIYLGKIAPNPPEYFAVLFNNTYFKMLCLVTIAYLSNIDFSLSLILGVGFVVIINWLAGRGPLESFGQVSRSVYTSENQDWIGDFSKVTTLLGKPTELSSAKILESTTDNYPGCLDVKISDLLAVFETNAKLQQHLDYTYQQLYATATNESARERLEAFARYAGVNGNLPLTDANAPYIATMLLNKGFKITDSCSAPSA